MACSYTTFYLLFHSITLANGVLYYARKMGKLPTIFFHAIQFNNAACRDFWFAHTLHLIITALRCDRVKNWVEPCEPSIKTTYCP